MEIGLTSRNGASSMVSPQSTSNGDFETFLKMLTAQIQNQDPLSPLQADEFASQLASFSMVEQQTLTNQKLDALMGTQPVGSFAQFASLVGQSVAHDAAFQFNGAPVQFEIEGRGAIGDAKVFVVDIDGNVVAEQGITPGATRLTWNGLDTGGGLVPVGRYTAELRSVTSDQKIEGRVLTQAEVEEVRITDAGAVLMLTDGSLVPQDNIRVLR